MSCVASSAQRNSSMTRGDGQELEDFFCLPIRRRTRRSWFSSSFWRRCFSDWVGFVVFEGSCLAASTTSVIDAVEETNKSKHQTKSGTARGILFLRSRTIFVCLAGTVYSVPYERIRCSSPVSLFQSRTDGCKYMSLSLYSGLRQSTRSSTPCLVYPMMDDMCMASKKLRFVT